MAPAGRLQPLLLQARADRFGHDPRRPLVSPTRCGCIGAARCRPPSRACRRSARGRAHPVRRRQGELTRRGARRGGACASPREKRRAERRCAASIARASWPCRRIQSRWRALRVVTSRSGAGVGTGIEASWRRADGVRAGSLTRAYLHGSLIARARAGTVAPSWPDPAEGSRPSLADNQTMIRRSLRMVTDAGTRTNHRRRGGGRRAARRATGDQTVAAPGAAASRIASRSRFRALTAPSWRVSTRCSFAWCEPTAIRAAHAHSGRPPRAQTDPAPASASPWRSRRQSTPVRRAWCSSEASVSYRPVMTPAYRRGSPFRLASRAGPRLVFVQPGSQRPPAKAPLAAASVGSSLDLRSRFYRRVRHAGDSRALLHTRRLQGLPCADVRRRLGQLCVRGRA